MSERMAFLISCKQKQKRNIPIIKIQLKSNPALFLIFNFICKHRGLVQLASFSGNDHVYSSLGINNLKETLSCIIVTPDFCLRLVCFLHFERRKTLPTHTGVWGDQTETLLCFCRVLRWSRGSRDSLPNRAGPLGQGPQCQSGRTADTEEGLIKGI